MSCNRPDTAQNEYGTTQNKTRLLDTGIAQTYPPMKLIVCADEKRGDGNHYLSTTPKWFNELKPNSAYVL